METVLTMLLIRFGLIVGGLVVLALVVFAVALVLRRRGKLDSARERVAPLARGVAQLLADRARQPRDSQYDDPSTAIPSTAIVSTVTVTSVVAGVGGAPAAGSVATWPGPRRVTWPMIVAGEGGADDPPGRFGTGPSSADRSVDQDGDRHRCRGPAGRGDGRPLAPARLTLLASCRWRRGQTADGTVSGSPNAVK